MEFQSGKSLARVNADTLWKADSPLTIGMLEQALLAVYRKEDAESWDRTGLLCGSRNELVEKIALSLDATEESLRMCERIGVNVLVTHHPAFLDPPESFGPENVPLRHGGAVIYSAIQKGIALMNFHTALDFNPDARILCAMLGFEFERYIHPLEHDEGKGYGLVCTFAKDDDAFTLRRLAARCVSVFGSIPRVWGDDSTPLGTVCIAQGSGGNVMEDAVEQGIDCMITGEVKYHAALEASQAGMCIIELGHDASEMPLVIALANTIRSFGIPPEKVEIIGQEQRWWVPETTRV